MHALNECQNFSTVKSCQVTAIKYADDQLLIVKSVDASLKDFVAM